MDTAAIEPALDEVRSLVQADGGDLTLASVDEASGTVALDLVLEGANCVECVMPREFLEQIALDMLGQKVPGVKAVSIADPREDPNWVAPEH